MNGAKGRIVFNFFFIIVLLLPVLAIILTLGLPYFFPIDQVTVYLSTIVLQAPFAFISVIVVVFNLKGASNQAQMSTGASM